MIKLPKLDNRTKKDILDEISGHAAVYAPEWRYSRPAQWNSSAQNGKSSGQGETGEISGTDVDPGAVIAELYADMFAQTVERYNRIPEKYYAQLLRILGAVPPPSCAASGYVRFSANDASASSIDVPAGTEVFAAAETMLIYTTSRKISATPANLEEILYVNNGEGMISPVTLDEPREFFRGGETNLQRHYLTVSCGELLSIRGACVVTLELTQTSHFAEADAAKLLTGEQAKWYWLSERGKVPFDSQTSDDNRLILTKNSNERAVADENELNSDGEARVCVYCELSSSIAGEIKVKGLAIKTALAAPQTTDALFSGSYPVDDGGGYCFGERPSEGETFYIRSDDVFSKAGSTAAVTIDIVTVEKCDFDPKAPVYDFSSGGIIDKTSAPTITPDDIYVESVVWEYFNGIGWTKLSVNGDVNPFNCKNREDGKRRLVFNVPNDLLKIDVGSIEGRYIRARIRHVENYYSMTGRRLLPFVKAASAEYSYSGCVNVDYIKAENNASAAVVENASDVSDLNLALFAPAEVSGRSMYLRFDRSPDAMPLAVMFSLIGAPSPKRCGGSIIYEGFFNEGFERLKISDETDGLRFGGTVLLYIPEPLKKTSMFGREGYWLRMTTKLEDFSPKVEAVFLNTVRCFQKSRASSESFSCGVCEPGKVIGLYNTPVLDCDVWVDEKSSIADGEAVKISKNSPDDIRLEYSDGVISRCEIRWKRAASLEFCGPEDRVFMLASYSGRLGFGDGFKGRIPPEGRMNITVDYTYGGGIAGNVPPNTIKSLVGSIPNISAVTNVTAMCGGSDRMSDEKLLTLGNRRIRHQGRAVTAFDFENLVAENFAAAGKVKCFEGVNAAGKPEKGHVCVAVMSGRDDTESMRENLCSDIFEFLSERCDCNLLYGGRLHVIPAVEIEISVTSEAALDDLDRASEIEDEVASSLRRLIEIEWRSRDIGAQIRLDDIYSCLGAVRGIRWVGKIMVAGSWYKDGRKIMRAIENDDDYPFATVRSGIHQIKLISI